MVLDASCALGETHCKPLWLWLLSSILGGKYHDVSVFSLRRAFLPNVLTKSPQLTVFLPIDVYPYQPCLQNPVLPKEWHRVCPLCHCRAVSRTSYCHAFLVFREIIGVYLLCSAQSPSYLGTGNPPLIDRPRSTLCSLDMSETWFSLPSAVPS